MSDFSVPVVTIAAIEPIPGADAIELAVIGDYRSVVRKGQFIAGQLAIYMPESSVLPDALIKYIGLEGKLSGGAKNRIKAVKLRGCLSQGILLALPAELPIIEGADCAALLGIEKYAPHIPMHMAGEMGEMFGKTVPYDIENIKKHNTWLYEGEPVVFTEKLHGTWCGITIVPDLDSDEVLDRDTLVYSKGLGKKGFVFKDNLANANNLYMKTVKSLGIHKRLSSVFPYLDVTIMGEIYGIGVQDLHYGETTPTFRAFEIYLGKYPMGRFLDVNDFEAACERAEIETVPFLYMGPYSKEAMLEHTTGKTTLGEHHIREGIVIRPSIERRNGRGERIILKSVSEEYLLRKDGTEFN